ncbi:lysozyme family protein, partial [Streptomyces diastaticus]
GFNGTVTPGAGIPPEYMQYYLAAEKIYKVDWYYLAAFHSVETQFSTHPTMISSVGAEGHLQVRP